MDKPSSFSEGLQRAAMFLDISDDLAREVLPNYNPGDSVQKDLRLVALWIQDNPNSTVAELNDYFLSLVES